MDNSDTVTNDHFYTLSERFKMNNKFRTSSHVSTNSDSNNLQVKFKIFLPNPAELDKSLFAGSISTKRVYTSATVTKKQMKNSIPELNPALEVLHAAHKGMHPVLFTVLAALHEVLNSQGTVAGLGK